MKILQVSGRAILDSRKEKTILISVKTNIGSFSASSPTGKSTGKYEAKPYKKSLEGDIKKVKEFSDYFSEEEFVCFDDLEKIEEVLDRQVGANTMFALESAVLKAIAKEKGKEVWEIVYSSHDLPAKARTPKLPYLVGNVIGGGKHSSSAPKGVPPSTKKKDLSEGGKPDFQEFLLISKNWNLLKKAKTEAEELLKKFDENFRSKKNDENAWMTSLNEKIVLDILYRLKKKFKIQIGLDIAASSFNKRKKYHYLNPKLDRDCDEQFGYLSNLIKNYGIFYIEDGFGEDEFDDFAKLLRKFKNRLIVGDDLTTTNLKRLNKAIEKKSISAIIVKPNQIGSLLEVREVCKLARKNKIKIVFSHRSGETEESILADLGFGFGADYFKCGIDGKEREAKMERLIDIRKSIL